MANTKRGNIEANIQALIEALGSITIAEVNSTRALHAAAANKIPFVNITSEGEYNAAKSGTGVTRQQWDLTTTLTILTLNNDIEDLRGDIKVAMEDDRTRGGNAINTVYERDTTNIDFDIPTGAQAMLMIFTITYILSGGAKI